MPTIKRIKEKQAKLIEKLKGQLDLSAPAKHQPEVLLIGCVDARLDIVADLGIPRGKALIYRNIAALVHGNHATGEGDNISVLAALEFAINVMKVMHVVVMGHTDCGGIRASLTASADEHKAIKHYLSPLDAVRTATIQQGGGLEDQARAMEKAAVKQSIENLKGYYVVRDALANKQIQLHGWVIDTGTGIFEEIY